MNLNNYNSWLNRRQSIPIKYISKKGRFLIKEYITNKITKGLQNKIKILDLGCGDNALWNKDCIQKGYDVDKNNKNADYHSLDEIKENFDIIVMVCVIEFMDDITLSKCIDWVFTHCNELIILTPIDNGFNNFHQDIFHCKLRYSNSYSDYLKEKGFTKIDMVYCTPFSEYNYLKITLQKIICWIFNTHIYNQLLIIAKK